jgi:hypothetical protein
MNILKFRSLLAGILVLAVTACAPQKTEEQQIRDISAGYLKALVDYRLDDARAYGDGSTAQFLGEQQAIIDSWQPAEREEMRKKLENTDVTISGVDINEDKATVMYEFIQSSQVLQSERLYLVKTSQGWQVHESME